MWDGCFCPSKMNPIFLFFYQPNPTKLAMKIETWFESRPDFLSLAVCEKNLFLKVRTWRKGIAEPIFVNLFGSCCRKDWEYKLWRQFWSTVSTMKFYKCVKSTRVQFLLHLHIDFNSFFAILIFSFAHNFSIENRCLEMYFCLTKNNVLTIEYK